MLTITTNKDEVAAIAKGEITKRALPLNDFWEKRIISLLGFSESARKEIIHNLREGREGTTSAEREVIFTAGGYAKVRVKATVSIGKVNPLASETFVLTIAEVLEVEGAFRRAENTPYPILDEDKAQTCPAQDIEESEEGMPNTPAIRTVSEHVGFCRFCNQSVFVKAPDNLSGADYNQIATQECNCDEAQRERNKKAKMEAAGMWAKNIFSKQDGQLQLVLCAIRATFEGNVDYCTIKLGKHRYKIDRDADGMIRIKGTYTESDVETF